MTKSSCSWKQGHWLECLVSSPPWFTHRVQPVCLIYQNHSEISRGTHFPFANRNYLFCAVYPVSWSNLFLTCYRCIEKSTCLQNEVKSDLHHSQCSKITSPQLLAMSCDFFFFFSTFRATTGSAEAEFCTRSCSHKHFPLLQNSTDTWKHSWWNTVRS